jgi:hypothetical protein
MDAKFASTTHSQISQSEAFLSLGLFDKTNFTSSYIVPENGLLYVQVLLRVKLQVDLYINLQSCTSAFKCSYKCSFCLIVILTVIFRILDSSF